MGGPGYRGSVYGSHVGLGGWVCGGCLFDFFSFFFAVIVLGGGFFFASRVPLCLRVHGFGAFGFLWEREQVCDNVKRCKGG